jgi:hypothetical protein
VHGITEHARARHVLARLLLQGVVDDQGDPTGRHKPI